MDFQSKSMRVNTAWRSAMYELRRQRTLPVLATLRRHHAAGGHPLLPDLQGREFAQPRLLHPHPRTGWRGWRRHGQLHRRLGNHSRSCEPYGHSHRHRRWRLPRGVRPGHGPCQRSSLYRRRTQRRSLHRDGHRGLLADRGAAEALLRIRRRRCARHHDDSHDHSHHRRDAGHCAPCDSRSGPRPRRSQVAHGPLSQPAHGIARHHHRLHAGLRACRRRDSAAALYRLRQPVLELQTERADRRSAAADLRLRHLARTTNGIVSHGQVRSFLSL